MRNASTFAESVRVTVDAALNFVASEGYERAAALDLMQNMARVADDVRFADSITEQWISECLSLMVSGLSKPEFVIQREEPTTRARVT